MLIYHILGTKNNWIGKVKYCYYIWRHLSLILLYFLFFLSPQLEENLLFYSSRQISNSSQETAIYYKIQCFPSHIICLASFYHLSRKIPLGGPLAVIYLLQSKQASLLKESSLAWSFWPQYVWLLVWIPHAEFSCSPPPEVMADTASPLRWVSRNTRWPFSFFIICLNLEKIISLLISPSEFP